jgi:dCMP deaminase
MSTVPAINDRWIEKIQRFVTTAETLSKDRSHGVGCVIVDQEMGIRTVAYNGFPRGVIDEGKDVIKWLLANGYTTSTFATEKVTSLMQDVEARHNRPDKYFFTEHAERNAIYACARAGTATNNCIMVIKWFPCADCARAIIQAGIKTLVACHPDLNDERWGHSWAIALKMLTESKIQIIYTD